MIDVPTETLIGGHHRWPRSAAAMDAWCVVLGDTEVAPTVTSIAAVNVLAVGVLAADLQSPVARTHEQAG